MLGDNQLTTSPHDIGELKELVWDVGKMLLVTGNPGTWQKMKKVVKIQKKSSDTRAHLYLLRVLFKISNKHRCLFYNGFPLLQGLTRKQRHKKKGFKLILTK